MTSGARISVVIRCCNEEHHIGRLLTGLLEQRPAAPHEIILVDSGSTDATLAIASRFPVRAVHIPRESFSFGRSLNLGCRHATGDLLVFASAHVYPLRGDWLARLTAPLVTSASVALAYGRQIGDWRTRYSEHQVFARWFPPASDPDQGHPFCNNANAAIRRALWQEMPYDETLTGLEDLDWAKRALARGLRLSYVADAVVAHVHEESESQIRNRYRREAIALKSIFPEQRFSAVDFARMVAGNVASDWVHAWREGCFGEVWRDVVRFRWNQFLGTYRGFAQRESPSDGLRQTFYYPNALHRRAETPAAPDGAERIDYGRLLGEAAPREGQA